MRRTTKVRPPVRRPRPVRSHVKITVEPNESGKGYEFVNDIVGGAIPEGVYPAVDAGIQGAMQSGVARRLYRLWT